MLSCMSDRVVTKPSDNKEGRACNFRRLRIANGRYPASAKPKPERPAQFPRMTKERKDDRSTANCAGDWLKTEPKSLIQPHFWPRSRWTERTVSTNIVSWSMNSLQNCF